MVTSNTPRRAGLAAFAAALAIGGSVALAGPAGAAPGDVYIPPLSCGMTRTEVGPLSSLVHRLEPAVRAVRLEYAIHDLNCSLVIGLERATGLQSPGPFG